MVKYLFTILMLFGVARAQVFMNAVMYGDRFIPAKYAPKSCFLSYSDTLIIGDTTSITIPVWHQPAPLINGSMPNRIAGYAVVKPDEQGKLIVITRLNLKHKEITGKTFLPGFDTR